MAQSRPAPAPHPTERLIGQSPALHALQAQIRHLAAFDTIGNPDVPTVLLQGETGTGKGLVARIIHDSGARAAGPFIGVNCAAIPESMLEAEIFGFEAGAFTDAKRPMPGLVEAASEGTLFLDEIAELPMPPQSKLLNVIEEKHVRRLGAVAGRAVDVKLVAAAQGELRGNVGAALRGRPQEGNRRGLPLPPKIQVPATVQAVLAARIDRLASDEKRLLQTAAVIGHEVPWPLMQAIAELPEADLHDALARLQGAEFLYETRLFPERTFAFKHLLTHEVVYGSLRQERRLHRSGNPPPCRWKSCVRGKPICARPVARSDVRTSRPPA